MANSVQKHDTTSMNSNKHQRLMIESDLETIKDKCNM